MLHLPDLMLWMIQLIDQTMGKVDFICIFIYLFILSLLLLLLLFLSNPEKLTALGLLPAVAVSIPTTTLCCISLIYC